MDLIKLEVPDVAAAIGVLETSLRREKLLLQRSISRTEKKLKEFEEKEGMSSQEFFEEFQKGLLGDNQTAMIWAGEYEASGLLEKELIATDRMLSQCK